MDHGSWYYLDPATGQMATGWTQIDGTWFYLSSSGVMRTGWVKDGGAWYYLSPSGSMVTGWQLLGGTWYHWRQRCDDHRLVPGRTRLVLPAL